MRVSATQIILTNDEWNSPALSQIRDWLLNHPMALSGVEQTSSQIVLTLQMPDGRDVMYEAIKLALA